MFLPSTVRRSRRAFQGSSPPRETPPTPGRGTNLDSSAQYHKSVGDAPLSAANLPASAHFARNDRSRPALPHRPGKGCGGVQRIQDTPSRPGDIGGPVMSSVSRRQEEESVAMSAVTPGRFAKGMTFDEYVRYAGSAENLAREAFGGY